MKGSKTHLQLKNLEKASDHVRSSQHLYQELADSNFDNENARLKKWLPSALGAAISFFAGNSITSTVTANVDGLAAIFYLSAGAIFCGACHMIIMSCRRGCKWHPQNIIVDGKTRWLNVVRFILQCCMFFAVQAFKFLTMYYSHMAHVNVGIITTLWSVQPLAAAFLDYLIYGEKLTIYHLVGIVMVVASAFCISFSRVEPMAPELSNPHPFAEMYDEKFPKWIAVVFGILTPCVFVAGGLWIKHMTKPHVGFDAMTVSFSSAFVTSVITIIIGVTWYWKSVSPFQKKLFLIGFFGSIFESFGQAFIYKAYSNGPAGPVSSFVELNNMVLIVSEAIKYRKIPSWLELLGFVLAVLGALVLCIPREITNLLKCMFCCMCPCQKRE